MADDAPADRRRAVPRRRAHVAVAGEVPARDHQGGRGRPAARRSRSRHRSPRTRSTSSGRTSRSSGRSRRSCWRWGPWPRNGIGARPRSSCRRASRAGRSSGPRSSGSGSCWRCASGCRSCSAGSTRPSCSSRCRSVGWIAFALLAWLGLAAWAAITFLASTVTGSTAAAAGIGFGALLLLSIVAAIPNVGPVPAGRARGAGRRAGARGAGRGRGRDRAGDLDGRADRARRGRGGLVVPAPGALIRRNAALVAFGAIPRRTLRQTHAPSPGRSEVASDASPEQIEPGLEPAAGRHRCIRRKNRAQKSPTSQPPATVHASDASRGRTARCSTGSRP